MRFLQGLALRHQSLNSETATTLSFARLEGPPFAAHLFTAVAATDPDYAVSPSSDLVNNKQSRESLSKKINNAVMPILGLLLRCGPSTILRGVPSIVVDAFQALSFWPRTHVGKEVPKDIPSVANSNTAPPVTMVRGHLGIAATLPHRNPGGVLRSAVYAVPVDATDTTTGHRNTESQLTSSNFVVVPAVALTEPEPLIISFTDNANSNELAESLPSHVFSSHTKSITNALVMC